MTDQTGLQRISPDDLPELLMRLKGEQIIDLALVGLGIPLSASPDNWPSALQGRIVFQLTRQLSGLPHELLLLDQLEILTLWGLGLTDADVEAIASKLSQLNSLDLSSNNIGDAGAQAIASKLSQLSSLDLNSNNIGVEGAQAIAEYLTQLTTLSLNDNGVIDNGAQVIAENLTHLTTLNLNNNGVGVDGALTIAAYLTQLKSLDISHNQVGVDGARAIAEYLAQLESLNLGGNQIGVDGVRAIAEHLTYLTSLDISQCLIGDDGVRVIAKHLNRLSSLNMSYNGVGVNGARAIAKYLTQLKSLNLGGNKIGVNGSRAIAKNLIQLTTLNLSNNEVGDDGAKVIAEYLTQLTSLNLGGNQVGINGIRAITEYLTHLKSLILWNNEVGDDGAQLIAKHLTHLTSLNLNNNGVSDDGVQAIAENLTQLHSLELYNNDISDESVVTIAQQLKELVILDLERNKRITMVTPLAHLPISALSITDTGVVDLSSLKAWVLAGIPVKWQQYNSPMPSGIYVKNCQIIHPSPEIVQQGPAAVLNYFREIEVQGVDRLFEAKLLIVGEGGAGKTSLVRRLFLPEMALPKEDETTRGIDIYRHEFSISNGRTFRLNIWDFGGQQIYHATHQFFLTKRSLYVFVDDTRTDHRSIHDEGFKFWLEVVETLSEASPLLIFQNEKGGRSKTIDEAGIKGRFPNFKEIHRGNLERLGSADGLRQAVEYFAQNLPHIGEDVPAKWVAIRQDLEDLAKYQPYVSLKKYFEVYERHLDSDRDKALKLSQYLHDLGVFLYFQNPRELRQTIFLQNQWVTEAVFRILDDEKVKSNRGRFTLDDCDRLWSEQGYAEKELELRALMIRFELCYRLPDIEQETWLVPQHLSPAKSSELTDWESIGDLMLTYRYEFLPRGLVSRLIVRMHRFVKQPDLCWSNGALFEYDGTQVLVERTIRGNEITLRSRGSEKKALLSIIASDLDALNDSFQGLKDKVETWVPCICNTCISTTTPEFFAHKSLLKRKRDYKLTIECPESYDDVNVLELLDGLKLDQWPDWAKKESTPDDEPISSDKTPPKTENVVNEQMIRIFLASSSELREDRDAFELYFRQQNDRLLDQGIYLKIIRWENFLDAMSSTRLQDEYNQKVRNCDIFVSLFKTKTGKYTEEEFDVAHQAFQETGKPLIYTYFQKTTISTSSRNRKDLISLWDFQQKLQELEHYQTEYESIDDLQKRFRDQLDILRDEGRL